MEIGHVAAIWRYPVKALKAEPLRSATILKDGLEGDRTAALLVESPEHARAGKPYRGKESSRLHLTADPETAASYAADEGVQVSLDRSAPRWFDARPVSLLLDRWVRDAEALVGVPLDPLRWRPNLYVRADDAFARAEAELVGATLRIGTVVLRVLEPTRRCVTTTYDVQTGAAAPAVLERVANARENVMGVYCEVVYPGLVGLGDAVREIR